MIYNHEILLKSGQNAFGKEFNLVYVPECQEIAGSGTRQTAECFRIVYMCEGVRHSKAYKTFEAANDYFNKYTKPINAI